jgi:hypothetical protein
MEELLYNIQTLRGKLMAELQEMIGRTVLHVLFLIIRRGP